MNIFFAAQHQACLTEGNSPLKYIQFKHKKNVKANNIQITIQASTDARLFFRLHIAMQTLHHLHRILK